MANDKQTSKLTLSRRKILAGTGAIGASGLAAGLGASAFFSDDEQFANNQLTAGELDMKVSWEEHYSDWSEDEAEHAHMDEGELVIDDQEGFMEATLQEQFPDKRTRKRLDEGTADPCEVLADVPDDLEKPVIDIADVKPGDSGEVTFDFTLCDNPGWIWFNGSVLENNDNGSTEPESDSPDEDGSTAGELAEAIEVEIWQDDDCDNVFDPGEPVVFRGSLADAMSVLSSSPGIPLDGGMTEDAWSCFEEKTRHCLGFRWELPVDRGNEVQTDSVTFDLGFYTEQWRHNPQPQGDDSEDECQVTLKLTNYWYTGRDVASQELDAEKTGQTTSFTIDGKLKSLGDKGNVTQINENIELTHGKQAESLDKVLVEHCVSSCSEDWYLLYFSIPSFDEPTPKSDEEKNKDGSNDDISNFYHNPDRDDDGGDTPKSKLSCPEVPNTAPFPEDSPVPYDVPDFEPDVTKPGNPLVEAGKANLKLEFEITLKCVENCKGETG